MPPTLKSARTSAPLRLRPKLEALDERVVPATYNWIGPDTNPAVASNWGNPPGTPPPGINDDVYFEGISPNCVGLSGSVKSLHIRGQYNGTVSLAGSFTAGTYEQTGANLSQPANTTLTVTSAFTWKGGKLNSSSNLATVTISGSTTAALFEPTGGGTLELGSNIRLENGASGTMKDGAIDPNKSGLEFSTNSGSSFVIDPLGMAVLGVTEFLNGKIRAGTTWTVNPGIELRISGHLLNEGTYIISPGTLVRFTGDPEGLFDPVVYAQQAQAGAAPPATILYGGSEIVTATNYEIWISAGILATKYSSELDIADATIRTKMIEFSGGDIYIDYQGSGPQFGELVVDGNVWWHGGTFHPYVYADGMTNDVWRTTNASGNGATFEIDSGTVAPIYLDSDYGTSSYPTSGTSWKVLQAGGGFVDNTAPSVSDTVLWRMEIDAGGNPPIFWKLVAN